MEEHDTGGVPNQFVPGRPLLSSNGPTAIAQGNSSGIEALVLRFYRLLAHKKDSRRLSEEMAIELYAKRGDSVGIMPLGADVIRAGGSRAGVREPIVRDW